MSKNPMDDLSDQEVAVMLATKTSPYCQSAEEIAQVAETDDVSDILQSLCEKGILKGFEGWTAGDELKIVYMYGDAAQEIVKDWWVES